MGLKLGKDVSLDFPVLLCDVCGKRIVDYWNDLASGTSGTMDAPGDLVLHHQACATQQPLHMTLVDFFGLFLSRNRVGDVASDGLTSKAIVSVETNKGFAP